MIEREVSEPDLDRAIASRWTDPSKTPGIQYAAVNATGVVAAFTSGAADLRHGTPMTAATTMMAYSMSKVFTATAVLQLVECGEIGLDDAVTRYLPESPYGDAVTVAQLLAHTGGVPNPIPLRWVHPAAVHARFDEDAAFRATLRAHPRLRHRPGSTYAYSNIGYWILGKIVERASGQSFTSYVTAHVIRALGIADDDLCYTVPPNTPHATGYLEKYSLANLLKRWLIDSDLTGGYDGRWLRIESHYPNGPAFGGLVGTARGFGRFLQDQLQPQSMLLGDATRKAFYAQQRTATGRVLPMTLGWHIGERDGSRFFFKEGGGGGFHSLMRVYPMRGIASVVMTNATSFDVAGCLNALDGQMMTGATRRSARAG